MNLLRAITLYCVVFLSHSEAHAELAVVTPGYEIQLPRDGGSHSAFGTEWWYLTGWLQDESGVQRGFQITFFRSRNEAADKNPSKFAPKQILFAHVALSDPDKGKLLRGERTARAGFGLAEARESMTDVVVDDWFLRANDGGYATTIVANDFSLTLSLKTTQPPLLQGERGFSRKGPQPTSASYYYSLPQLAVQGSMSIQGGKYKVIGTAWFDHEWSSEYLDPKTQGWDWLGINMLDGDSVMAFRMRDAQENQYWAGGTWRTKDAAKTASPAEINWTPLRRWRSPRTGVEYPIAWRVKVGAREITLRPLLDDQENDARGSVGMLYWEGAVEALDETGKLIGRGYLELTGYGERVKL